MKPPVPRSRRHSARCRSATRLTCRRGPRRFLTAGLLVALLCAGIQPVVAAAPATPSPVPVATQGRRIVSVAAVDPFFPQVSTSFELGNDIHVPDPTCDAYPPELDLQYLTLDRTAGGYEAAVIFFAPIRPLTELNGIKVTHTVRLTSTPPDRQTLLFSAILGSGKLTVTRGKTKLTATEARGSGAALQGDRVLFAIPDRLKIAPDWQVSASVILQTKETICPGMLQDGTTRLQRGTPPVTVGSLTGEDPAGTITFAGGVTDGATSLPPYRPPYVSAKMPDGSKITSLRFEQDAAGGLVVVATVGAKLADLAKHAKEGQKVVVELNLADPSFFGLEYPYSIRWDWFLSLPMPQTASVFGPNYSGVDRGSVPVTIDGNELRFDLGGYLASGDDQHDLGQSTVLPAPFGSFATSFVSDASLGDPICLCSPSEATQFHPSSSPTEDQITFVIYGNLLSATSAESGKTAYGWIDHYGHFLARDDTEQYRGVIKFVPNSGGYDIGVHAVLLHAEPTTTVESREEEASGERALVPTAHSFSELIQLLISTNAENVLTLIIIQDFFGNPQDTADDQFDAEHLRKNTDGSSNPPDPFEAPWLAFGLSFPGELQTTAAFPFPLPQTPSKESTAPTPFDPSNPSQPTPLDTDWAIRAGSFFVDADGSIAMVAGPFVDSHLLARPVATTPDVAAMAYQAPPFYLDGEQRRIRAFLRGPQ
jgi:hypothetical protein